MDLVELLGDGPDFGLLVRIVAQDVREQKQILLVLIQKLVEDQVLLVVSCSQSQVQICKVSKVLRDPSEQQVAVLKFPEEHPDLWVLVHLVMVTALELLVVGLAVRELGPEENP